MSNKLSGDYTYHEGLNGYKDILKNKNAESMTIDGNFEYLKENIYSEVLNYCYNEDFILVKQKPNIEYHIKALIFELEDSYSNSRSVFLADSLINNDVYYRQIFDNEINYWIIDSRNEILLGPFQKNEYLNKRNDLRIPQELEFK
ncbi:MAG TPA: hypothetical protein PKX84_04420 [Bacteroidia bacterium]|nr:hypothetical protein [Bacteroidia bacterium]